MNAVALTGQVGETGRCLRCGRSLKNPESVERGFGPVCWRKVMGDTGGGEPANDLPFDPKTMDIVAARRPHPTLRQWDGGEVLVLKTNVPQRVVHHSPTGFEVGYGGSGPADFALNILELFVPAGQDGRDPVVCHRGVCSAFAWRHYQEFKREVIERMPHEGGTISGQFIKDWIAERLKP